MVGATTQGKDEGQEDNTDDGDDLETGQPEFEFAEETDAEVVDAADDDQQDGDEDTRVDNIAIDPVLDNQGCRSQLVRGDDDVLEPIPAVPRESVASQSQGIKLGTTQRLTSIPGQIPDWGRRTSRRNR